MRNLVVENYISSPLASTEQWRCDNVGIEPYLDVCVESSVKKGSGGMAKLSPEIHSRWKSGGFASHLTSYVARVCTGQGEERIGQRTGEEKQQAPSSTPEAVGGVPAEKRSAVSFISRGRSQLVGWHPRIPRFASLPPWPLTEALERVRGHTLAETAASPARQQWAFSGAGWSYPWRVPGLTLNF